MKISVVESDEISAFESDLNKYLVSIFGPNSKFIFNQEFECAVIVADENQIIATGFAYRRLMKQGSMNFNAAIIGGIAVTPDKRGFGLTKSVMSTLEKHLISIDISHSFLFAYEPAVYRSSGFKELAAPINYYDVKQKVWNQFVYSGGMVKTYHGGHFSSEQVIEFNGCVY